MTNDSFPSKLDLRVDSMAQGGDGVGRWQGRVVFANGALPGEYVEVALYEQRPAFARGRVITVHEASPYRVEPRVAKDGHASWQHIAYEAQLRFKEQIVREQLSKLAGLDNAPVLPCLPAARPWGYRNTAQLHADDERIGYYAPDSQDVIDLPEDPLLLPVLNDVLRELRATLNEQRYREGSAPPEIHSVTLRGSEACGYAIAALGGRGSLEALATRWLARTPQLAAVQTPSSLSTHANLHEELGGIIFALGIESFFQTHTAQAERMLELVREGLQLQAGERLLDAYGGVGTFGLPLAAGLSEVVVIEESAQAVADGRATAELNEIGNARFVQGPVERVLPTLNDTFNAVVLDPPRRGCHPAALAGLIALRPSRIAYISCHPGILARDLRPLLAAGYQLRSVQPVDLFPQTPHIECVVLLENRE
jgi:23S rRNA (uracil1939-C5)-methyltransferase